MNRRFFAEFLIVMTLLLIASGSIAAQQQSRFHSSQETGGAPGRFRVQIELRPGDDLVAISGQLAATYGARVEPYAEEGFTGFAIMATPTRARLMSNDPRVVAITDLNSPSQPAEPVAPVQSRTPSPVAEQVRMVLTSEAVPGLGSYSYDGSGNITSIDNHVFRYDALGRLQNAVLGSFGSQAFTYDRYGNILKIVSNGDDANAARMGVDPETNQMDLQSGGSNPANMIATYDGVGNIITHNGSFVYDALNAMKETTDTARRLHVYSASNERVMVIQVANGVETTSEWTLRDGSNRVLRRLTKDSAGVWQWKEDYIYGGSHLLAAEVPGLERVRHFHVDHLGTPRLITGNGGVRIAEKTYAPFGRKVSAVTADFEQLEFTGHERDTPSLDYMHARYYQPDLGRFFSVDPAQASARPKLPQTWNRYAYARNNPILRIDPDGLVDRRSIADLRITESQAGLRAGNFLHQQTNVEWSSTILQVTTPSGDSVLRATAPRTDHRADAVGGVLPAPGVKNMQGVAVFHNHVPPGEYLVPGSAQGTVRTFTPTNPAAPSNEDHQTVDSTGVTGYVVVPSANVLVRVSPGCESEVILSEEDYLEWIELAAAQDPTP